VRVCGDSDGLPRVAPTWSLGYAKTRVIEGVYHAGSGSFYDSVPIYESADRTSAIGSFSP
jgi:hypothetical protein